MTQNHTTNQTGNTSLVPPTPGPLPGNQPPVLNMTAPQPQVSPDAARVVASGRPAPGNVYTPPVQTSVRSLASGVASNTSQGAASIVEMARALKNDPDLIYEFVFNNIETLGNFGQHKGALGALIDGMGNSFDQADLMVQLLRQAGFTANYMFGDLRMTAAQAAAWLGTDPLNIWASANLLSNGGVPNAINNVSGTDYLDFSHCWLKVNISGTDYIFDPTIKSYSTKAAINLDTALGFNSTTFMTRAKTGATVTADYVQNMNRANIRADLTTMTTNLVSWIKTNNSGASLDDIVGGRTINQVDALVPLRQTTHPRQKVGVTPVVWTAIPNSYRATLNVVYDTINTTFFTSDLSGKRLTLFFNASHQAEVRLDGALIGTSSAQAPGGWNSVLLSIVHPYSSTFADQAVWHRIWTDKLYLLANAFGNAGRKASQMHAEVLKQARFNGNADTTEIVAGETLAVIWHNWNAENSKVADLLNRMSNCATVFHHQCGLVGWFDSPLTDLGAISGATSALDNNYNQQQYCDTTLAMHGVALEAQVLQQYGGINAISTTPLVDLANSAGQKIYDAKTANWLGTVKPALTGYAAGDVTNIENWYVNAGWRVVLPQNGSIVKDSWTGFGYYVIPSFGGTYGLIGGSLKGAGGASYLNVPGMVAFTSTSSCGCSNGVAPGGGVLKVGEVTSFEPIDMVSGAYLLEQTDLTVGSQAFPYGLGFTRSYTSGNRLEDGPIGLGWKHNFQMSVVTNTEGLVGLADQAPINGAAAIVELYVSTKLASDLTKPLDKYVTCALSNQWFIDQLTNNTAVVILGHQTVLFTKLPDGTYTPQAKSNGKLTFSGGLFTFKTLQGRAVNFNSAGQISTWVEPYGVTVTFTYTSGKLTSISNGLGRTLTLAYTGALLTSVSDGNGRSVTFSVDGSKNLVTVVDPNSKNWTYQYDQPGRMTKFFKPANPTNAVATNVYDTLNRVKQQTDCAGNLWQYYFAGSRSEEVNPNGKRATIYVDRNGMVVKSINQVGKICTNIYDGRSRITKAVMPEGNYKTFVYDSNDLLKQTTAVAKSGSGLANIVTSFTYDTTWFKLKTSVDGLGRTTTFNYDPLNGNLLSAVSPTVTGSGTPQVNLTYNSRGQILTATDPTGIVLRNTYDPSTEKLTSIVHDYGAGRLNITMNLGYNAVGDVTSIQDARGNTTNYVFNALRRLTQITEPSPFSYITKVTYNDNGMKTKVERQTGDLVTPWQTTQATFDIDDSLLTLVDAQSNTTTLLYDSLRRLWKITDPVSRVVTKTYDDANRPYIETDASNTVCATCLYTNNGLLASIKDARNNTTSYTYDGFDRPNLTTYQDGSYEQRSSYDANGNSGTFRTRSGNTILRTFDELNRVKTKTPQAQATMTAVYDLAGRLTSTSVPVVAGDPSTGTFQLFYDTAGRFFKEQYPDGKTVIHILDANGNTTKTTYPDGSYFVDRIYDQLNRLTDIKLNGAVSSAVQFQYDQLSRRKKLIYENGSTTDYTFEIDNDLSSLIQTFVGSSVTFTYGYDNVNQASSQQVSDSQYLWHPLTAGTVTYGTADSVNKYPSVGGTAYSYNGNACLAGDGTWTFGYNTEKMLTSASKTGTSVSYSYDPLLRQVLKNVGGTKTQYYYAGQQRIADYSGAGVLQDRYVYGAGLDDILIKVNTSGTKTYYHQDKLGSVIALTDAGGAVTNRYAYDPFGGAVSMTGTTHGFTGQRFDADTGLYHYKARYYSPKLGRFLQPDPAGYSDGPNMYSYASNSPLNATDPSGLASGIPWSSGNYFSDILIWGPGWANRLWAGAGISFAGGGGFGAGEATTSSKSSSSGSSADPAGGYGADATGTSVLGGLGGGGTGSTGGESSTAELAGATLALAPLTIFVGGAIIVIALSIRLSPAQQKLLLDTCTAAIVNLSSMMPNRRCFDLAMAAFVDTIQRASSKIHSPFDIAWVGAAVLAATASAWTAYNKCKKEDDAGGAAGQFANPPTPVLGSPVAGATFALPNALNSLLSWMYANGWPLSGGPSQ